MTAVTITKVADETRAFTTQNGDFASFKVWFENGQAGEVTAKADNVAKRQEQFRGFIGTPTELIVEDAGSFPDGNPKPLKVKLPQQQPQGKRDYVPRFLDTEEGWAKNDERVDRRKAWELAQAEGTSITSELAEKIYRWLRATSSNPLPERGFVQAEQVKRPESADYGEGSAGSGEHPGTSEGRGDAAVGGGQAKVSSSSELVAEEPAPPAADPVEEPHEHVAGPRKYANGDAMCRTCGKRFRAPTVFTEPPKERADLSS